MYYVYSRGKLITEMIIQKIVKVLHTPEMNGTEIHGLKRKKQVENKTNIDNKEVVLETRHILTFPYISTHQYVCCPAHGVILFHCQKTPYLGCLTHFQHLKM